MLARRRRLLIGATGSRRQPPARREDKRPAAEGDRRRDQGRQATGSRRRPPARPRKTSDRQPKATAGATKEDKRPATEGDRRRDRGRRATGSRRRSQARPSRGRLPLAWAASWATLQAQGSGERVSGRSETFPFSGSTGRFGPGNDGRWRSAGTGRNDADPSGARRRRPRGGPEPALDLRRTSGGIGAAGGGSFDAIPAWRTCRRLGAEHPRVGFAGIRRGAGGPRPGHRQSRLSPART